MWRAGRIPSRENLFATEGDHVSLAGTWEKHPKYGRQFKVDHVAIEMPQDAEGLAQQSRPRGTVVFRAW